MRKTAIERFYENTKMDENSECLIWIKSLDTSGYGMFKLNNKLISSHRFIYFYNYPKIATNFYICHKCDVKRCVNISHLFHATQYDNMQDMIQKHRDYHPSKEQNGNHKLTEKNVEKIRELYKPYDKQFNTYTLAKMFNVHPTIIGDIVNFKIWK